MPIVIALAHQVTVDIWAAYGDALLLDGASRLRADLPIMRIGRDGLLTAFLAAFARAIAEVGAIIIVGGNIRGYTRTMTTAIALETSKGDLSFALALGIILIVLSMTVSALSLTIGRALTNRRGGDCSHEPKAGFPESVRNRSVSNRTAFSCQADAQEKSIVVASTTSTQDSGLFGYLLPIVEEKTGIVVKVLALGTGQALDTARRGDADVVFVHAKSAEQKFLADGFGVRRYPMMYNDFVLIGPNDDPAGVKGRTF